jgi:leucyl-tRNA synthetase
MSTILKRKTVVFHGSRLWRLYSTSSARTTTVENLPNTLNFPALDVKWRQLWAVQSQRRKLLERTSTDFAAGNKKIVDPARKDRGKYYVLSMFPYPSGSLHLGHVRVYTISDTINRFRKMQGYKVCCLQYWTNIGYPSYGMGRIWITC